MLKFIITFVHCGVQSRRVHEESQKDKANQMPAHFSEIFCKKCALTALIIWGLVRAPDGGLPALLARMRGPN